MSATVPQARDTSAKSTGARRAAEGKEGIGEVGRQALVLCAGALAILAVMAGIGLLLTHTLAHTAIIRGDERLSNDLVSHRAAGWTSATWWATQAAESFTVIILALVAVAVLRVTTKRWLASIYVAVAVIGEASIYVVITFLVHRHRPTARHLDAAPPTSSFPSGHVAASVALYGSLAILAWVLYRRSPLRWVFTALAFIVPVAVAFSRVYRAMHFPTDVISGAVLGSGWLFWVTRVLRPSESDNDGRTSSRSPR